MECGRFRADCSRRDQLRPGSQTLIMFVIFRSSSLPTCEKLVLLVVLAERQPHAKRVRHI